MSWSLDANQNRFSLQIWWLCAPYILHSKHYKHDAAISILSLILDFTCRMIEAKIGGYRQLQYLQKNLRAGSLFLFFGGVYKMMSYQGSLVFLVVSLFIWVASLAEIKRTREPLPWRELLWSFDLIDDLRVLSTASQSHFACRCSSSCLADSAEWKELIHCILYCPYSPKTTSTHSWKIFIELCCSNRSGRFFVIKMCLADVVFSISWILYCAQKLFTIHVLTIVTWLDSNSLSNRT